MKFLFIYAPLQKLELGPNKNIYIKKGGRAPPLGVLYLGKVLENNGYDVEVIDFQCEEMSDQRLENKIRSVDAVGMTIYSGRSLETTTRLGKLIKDLDPNLPLVIGGPHLCFRSESVLMDHNADICVIREAEHTIKPLLEAIEGKRKLSSIPGIYYKENNEIKRNKPSELIQDLDSLPFPARHLVEKYDYGFVAGTRFSKGKTTSIVTSRGCAYGCRFCALHYVVPGFRKRSIENIKLEIDEIIDQGYKTLIFHDDNFLQNKKEAIQMMDYFIEKDADLQLWIEQARVDSADKELYKKMRKAGVDTIYFGIESGNQDVLDYYNKRITIPQIKKAVKLSKEMGFIVSGSFIFGAPIETKEHLDNTRKFVNSLKLDAAYFYPFNYLFGSPIWDEAVKEGKLKPDELCIVPDKRRSLGNFTDEWLIKYVDNAYKKFYFNPKFWARHFYRAFTKGDYRLLKLAFSLLS